jgi:SWI/SNF-related matrix-associated actin-dependent regulator of chromatin subfamily A member 5
MQELELNYPTTKGKVYSEEEDRYLLCRLNYYGMRADDVYERIKKDITEFPVFRFDWFFKSRSPQELQRRCNTLLGMIEKEAEVKQQEETKTTSKGAAKGKVCPLILCFWTFMTEESWFQKRNIEDVQKADKDLDDASRPSTPSVAPAPAAKRSHKKKKT